MSQKSKLEYIWLDGFKPTQSLRSKTMVRRDFKGNLDECPMWSFDGSSTRQAEGGSSDCLLKPVACYPDPVRKNAFLVMTAVLNADGKPSKQKVGERLVVDPTKERQICGGWYCTEDGQTTSVAHWLEEDDFRNNGGVMNHETLESIQKRRKPFTVDYTGFGWLLIKHGLFEHPEMPYPWFAPKMQVFESGEVQDMCGEDVSFCLDAKEAGFEIWCDPRIRVGHEKSRII